MRIDAHTHGMHAEKDANGRLTPPVIPIWKPGDSEQGINTAREMGIEKVVLLDPPEVAFALAENLPEFCIPVPQLPMEEASAQDVNALFRKGARGMKFIAPMHSYGDERYFPLYEAIRDEGGVAVFHTGFLGHGIFDPGDLLGRDAPIDITLMRPAALDRIGRTFPQLKMLMSHFGNPWWQEAWTVLKSNNNCYADFSGGTALTKAMSMWKELFAPDGQLHEQTVSKLCFASDGCPFFPETGNYRQIIAFHERLYEELNLPDELRRKINHENAEVLFTLGNP